MFPTICGTFKQKRAKGPSFGSLGSENGPLGTFEDQGAHLVYAGVLSLSVVLSVSVKHDVECQVRVNDVFYAVSLSGTM